MLNIVLYQPEIPPNTGNIMRLAANTGSRLHLIEPLGFKLDEKKLRRAGLDYRDFADVRTYPDYQSFLEKMRPQRVLALTTKGTRRYSEITYQANDSLLFGPETRGLPEHILDSLERSNRLLIPMTPQSRSLNLSNAVAVVVYEAWRQLGFGTGN